MSQRVFFFFDLYLSKFDWSVDRSSVRAYNSVKGTSNRHRKSFRTLCTPPFFFRIAVDEVGMDGERGRRMSEDDIRSVCGV